MLKTLNFAMDHKPKKSWGDKFSLAKMAPIPNENQIKHIRIFRKKN